MLRASITLQTVKIILSGLLISSLQLCDVRAQNDPSQNKGLNSHPVVSKETYNRVLDILFPREDPNEGKTVFELVLRFKPSFRPESQIIIRRSIDKIEILEYTSLDGDIYRKLSESVEASGKEDAVEMAKDLKVRRRVINRPPSKVKQWHATLFNSISATTRQLQKVVADFDKTRSESIVLDGTIYQFWYKQGLHKMEFSLYDFEVDTSSYGGELKLVQWMNAVRRDVERQK